MLETGHEIGDRAVPRGLSELWWVGVLLVGAAITRWPIITSPYTYIDGDEALQGVLVQHALERRTIPLFNLGAEFGLSFLETASAVFLALLFGLSEAVLNVSVFLIWLVGAACLVAAVHRAVGYRAALWTSLLAVITPAWFHFSNVSWGYHLSAFLMCHASLLMAVMVVDAKEPKRLQVAALGLFASLTYYTHPIFALTLIPVMGWIVWRRRRFADVWILAGVFGLCTLGYLFLRDQDAYWAPATFANVAVIESLLQMPRRLWVTGTGLYFLNEQLELGGATRALTYSWFILLGAAGVHTLASAVRRREVDLGIVCLMAIAMVCAFSVVVDRYMWGFRYLVPTIGFEVILIARFLDAWQRAWKPFRRWGAALAVVLFGLAMASITLEVSRAVGFSGSPVRTAGNEREAVRELVGFLDDRGIEHTYAWEGMLQWKLMFESQGRIKARWIYRTDRIPDYPPLVDRALRDGLPVAIFGEVSDLGGLGESIEATGVDVEPVIVANRYFVVVNPSEELVAHRFRLNE